jgi:hypothetical protein
MQGIRALFGIEVETSGAAPRTDRREECLRVGLEHHRCDPRGRPVDREAGGT